MLNYLNRLPYWVSPAVAALVLWVLGYFIFWHGVDQKELVFGTLTVPASLQGLVGVWLLLGSGFKVGQILTLRKARKESQESQTVGQRNVRLKQ